MNAHSFTRKPILPNAHTHASLARPARRRSAAYFEALERRNLLSATPTVSIVKTHDGSEINGSTTGAIIFTVSRTGGDPSQPLTVNYTIDTASTATGGTNYTAPSGSVIIPAGGPKATITIPVLNDGAADPTQTLILDLATGADYTILSLHASATANIADAAPTISITKKQDGSEADGANKGAAIFTVTRAAKDLSQPVTVFYTVDAASTATSGVDYVAPSGSVTIPAGQKSAQIAVTINADTVVDPNETLTLDLTANAAYHLDPKASKDSATAKIKDVPAVDIASVLQFLNAGRTWHYNASSGAITGTGDASVDAGTSSDFLYTDVLAGSGGQNVEFKIDWSQQSNSLVLNTFELEFESIDAMIDAGNLVASPQILAGTVSNSSAATGTLNGIAATLHGTAKSKMTFNGYKTITVPEGGPYQAAQITLTFSFSMTGTTASNQPVSLSGSDTFTFWAVPGKGIVKMTSKSQESAHAPQGSASFSRSITQSLVSTT